MRDALTGQLAGPPEFGLLQQVNAASRRTIRISTAQTRMLGNQAWADITIDETRLSGTVAWQRS